MARFDVVLQPGAPVTTDVYLRPNRTYTDVYLYPAPERTGDIYLRPNWNRPYPEGAGAAFPTQFSGLRYYDNGAVQDLCLVATADAPASMGGQLRIDKNGTVYAVYLVETTDGNASTIRIRTTTGTKALRLKT